MATTMINGTHERVAAFVGATETEVAHAWKLGVSLLTPHGCKLYPTGMSSSGSYSWALSGYSADGGDVTKDLTQWKTMVH